jgi:multiple sugar transport system permease protein
VRAVRQAGFALGLGLLIVVWAGPFFWMVLGSVKPPEAIIAPELVLRFSPTLEHYDAIFSRHAFWTYTWNSIVVAVSTTVITVTASVLAAYALSRYRSGGRLFEFWLIFTRMLPPATLLVPLFLLFRSLGLVNTLTGLVIADASFLLSFGIWLLRGFFDEVPVDLEEAAANDFITGYAINWGPVFASGVVIVLPVALAALGLQRHIVRGLTLGAFR